MSENKCRVGPNITNCKPDFRKPVMHHLNLKSGNPVEIGLTSRVADPGVLVRLKSGFNLNN